MYEDFINIMEDRSRQRMDIEFSIQIMKKQLDYFNEKTAEELNVFMQGVIKEILESGEEEKLQSIYWKSTPGITANFLSAYKQITEKTFKVVPRLTDVICMHCKIEKIYATSQTNYREIIAPRYWGICEKCRDKQEKEAIERYKKLNTERLENGGEFNIYELCKMDYSDYLKTTHWNRKRKAALKRADYTCEKCGEKETVLHVHHLSYEHKGNEYDDELMVLCAECHSKEHEADKQ